MEGKAVLFKRFADVDSIDVEVDTDDPDSSSNACGLRRQLRRHQSGRHQGPDCFIIEQRCARILDIPVFHDDQHGTAIIAAAGLINACELTGKDIKDLKVVVNGAGAAGIAVLELIKAMGVARQRDPVRFQGRHLQGPRPLHEPVEIRPCRRDRARTLEEAMDGADCFSACRSRAR
jgi:malate dehydrogenase (oxaloacetate-decarboxylating)(NADP+)